MRALQLAIARTQMAKALDELSVLVEFRDARIAEFRRVAFGDEDVAIGCKRDSRWTVEDIVACAAFALLAQRQQELAFGREFEDLIADAVSCVAVDGPDISLRIR